MSPQSLEVTPASWEKGSVMPPQGESPSAKDPATSPVPSFVDEEGNTDNTGNSKFCVLDASLQGWNGSAWVDHPKFYYEHSCVESDWWSAVYCNPGLAYGFCIPYRHLLIP